MRIGGKCAARARTRLSTLEPQHTQQSTPLDLDPTTTPARCVKILPLPRTSETTVILATSQVHNVCNRVYRKRKSLRGCATHVFLFVQMNTMSFSLSRARTSPHIRGPPRQPTCALFISSRRSRRPSYSFCPSCLRRPAGRASPGSR